MHSKGLGGPGLFDDLMHCSITLLMGVLPLSFLTFFRPARQSST